jgi:uncharacterized protein with GYD domain
VKDVLDATGAYDLATVLEAPDEKSVTALSVAVDARGNVRTQTLRAFPVEVMEQILASMPQVRVTSKAEECCGGGPSPG